jgi:hypothetical protein
VSWKDDEKRRCDTVSELLGVLYMLAFVGSLVFVYHDAKRRGQPLPLLHVIGVALIAPIGIFIYLGMRE